MLGRVGGHAESGGMEDGVVAERTIIAVRVQVLAVGLVLGAFAASAQAGYGGGTGTADHPFLIFTAQQLDALGRQPSDWDKHFRLMADIDLSVLGPDDFHSIGAADNGAFTGTFDGNRKTASNFRRASDFESYLGLFGFVEGEHARIESLTLVCPDVVSETGRYVAPLVGLLRDGTVENCHIRAGRSRGMNFVGGLVGRNEAGKINDCTVTATVQGIMRVGGLVGQNYYGRITGCRAQAAVSGLAQPTSWAIGGLVGENSNATLTACSACCTVVGDMYVGGLAGDNLLSTVDRCRSGGAVAGGSDVGGLIGRSNGGVVTDCYALAEVTGGAITGGLLGRHGPSCYCYVYEPGVVDRCYAAGPVAGATNTGGLIGLNERSTVERSFWDTTTTGCKTSDGGEGKTTFQMNSRDTWLNAGWDLVGEAQNGTADIWHGPAPGRYPRLAWEPVPGDCTGDDRLDLRDYGALAAQWRQSDTGFWCRGDCMAVDGVLDFDDLTDWTDAWLTHRR